MMTAEQHYLEALRRASKFSFVGGRLALTCSGNEGLTTLVFEAQPGAE
jgi:hypothetical protein